MVNCNVQTPLGVARLAGDENGVSSITLLNQNDPIDKKIPEALEACASQLRDYFNGDLAEFSFALNPKGTDFQKKVWHKLLEIPYGKTVSYLDLAKSLGDVNAIRAVAAANGKNPIWIAVPCHRVIGTDGSLVGYAGGLSRKQWLLDHESESSQLSLFN